MSAELAVLMVMIGVCMVGLAWILWVHVKPEPRPVRVQDRAGGRHPEYGDRRWKSLP